MHAAHKVNKIKFYLGKRVITLFPHLQSKGRKQTKTM